MKKVIKIENIDCANCALKIERNIAKINGVQNVSVNFFMQKITLEIDEANADLIIAEVEKVCKKVEPCCVLKGIK